MKTFLQISLFIFFPVLSVAQTSPVGSHKKNLASAVNDSSRYRACTSIYDYYEETNNGVPIAVKDKIFQPFFTTKPTGQGTGLGLSLSYDIIKSFEGSLRVEPGVGEGACFIIQLLAGISGNNSGNKENHR